MGIPVPAAAARTARPNLGGLPWRVGRNGEVLFASVLPTDAPGLGREISGWNGGALVGRTQVDHMDQDPPRGCVGQVERVQPKVVVVDEAFVADQLSAELEAVRRWVAVSIGMWVKREDMDGNWKEVNRY